MLRSPLARALGVALSIAGACYLLYLIAANVILRAGLLERWLGDEPDELLLEFDSAWTVWPGRVHVDDLVLRIGEEDLQLQLAFDRATVDLELFSLLKRTLHVTRLDADGMSFRFRQAVGPADSRLRVQALPPIAGFAKPPVAGTPSPPSTSVPWRFRIHGIDARVSELWVDEFRYEGPGRVEGAFDFAPKRSLEILDSRVRLGPGPLGLGTLRPIGSVLGDVTGRVDRLDVTDEGPQGWQVFSRFSLHGSLDAELADASFLEAYGPRVSRGAGALHVDLHLERGRFEQRSRAEYLTRDLALRIGKLEARGDAHARLDAHEGLGRLRISGSRITIDPGARIRDAELELVGDALDLTSEWKATRGHALVRSFRMPDLRFGNGSWKAVGGSLEASARADLAESGRVRANLDARFNGAELAIDDVRLHMTGSLEARLSQPSLTPPSGKLDRAVVELKHLSFATPSGASGSGKLSAKAVGRYRDARPEHLRVNFESTFPEAGPVLDALDVASGTPARIARALVDLEDLRVNGSLDHQPGRTRLRIWRASTDGVSARGTVKQRGTQTASAFSIDLGLVEIAIGNEPSR